ncbi:MAG: DUF2505 domain-containing protein [Myxococcales bacterium]|nr:DUF2505 domain-containing protein [Myxococcales bacterium]
MQFTLSDAYDMTPAQFWPMFFSPEFTTALYHDALGFHKYEQLENSVGPDGERTRRTRIYPKLKMPAPVRKLLGDGVHYIEDGHFSASEQIWRSTITVPKLGDRVRLDVRMRMEPRGETASMRFAEFDVQARLFGIGRIFEKFVEKALTENYGKATGFTNDWWHAHAAR